VGDGIRTRDPQIHNLGADSSKSMPSHGLEFPADGVSHHIPTDTCRNDPDLAAVIEAWDRLPEAIRAGILAMVQAAS
jgi:hypothetical protein